MKLVINSNESLSRAIGAIRDEFNRHKYLRVTVVSGKQRGVKFNALSWAWYQQVSIERGEYTPDQVHSYCKLHFGVPILRRDSEEFCAVYDANIKGLPYDTKLHIISMVPVTSTFTINQMKEYMEEVKQHHESMPTDPVVLLWPDDV